MGRRQRVADGDAASPSRQVQRLYIHTTHTAHCLEYTIRTSPRGEARHQTTRPPQQPASSSKNPSPCSRSYSKSSASGSQVFLFGALGLGPRFEPPTFSPGDVDASADHGLQSDVAV